MVFLHVFIIYLIIECNLFVLLLLALRVCLPFINFNNLIIIMYIIGGKAKKGFRKVYDPCVCQGLKPFSANDIPHVLKKKSRLLLKTWWSPHSHDIKSLEDLLTCKDCNLHLKCNNCLQIKCIKKFCKHKDGLQRLKRCRYCTNE